MAMAIIGRPRPADRNPVTEKWIMNRMLADAMGIVNVVLAVLIFVVVLAAGATSPLFLMFMSPIGKVVGLLVGLLGGVVSAVLVCGTLALLISAYGELKEIKQLLAARSAGASAGHPQSG